MFLSNFAEKCSLISSSITEGSIEGQKRCYEEFSGQWCQHNWNPLLFLRDNSVHNSADKFYCDVIPRKSCERMADRLTTTASFTVSNGGGVLRSSRPGCQHSQTGTVVVTVPGQCACSSSSTQTTTDYRLSATAKQPEQVSAGQLVCALLEASP